MVEFSSRIDDRTVSDIADASAQEIFHDLYDSCMLTVRPGETLEDVLERPRRENVDYDQDSRIRDTFHLDEIGGASFRDHVGLVLVNNLRLGCERLIWRDTRTFQISEKRFPLGAIEKIFAMFVDEICA